MGKTKKPVYATTVRDAQVGERLLRVLRNKRQYVQVTKVGKHIDVRVPRFDKHGAKSERYDLNGVSLSGAILYGTAELAERYAKQRAAADEAKALISHVHTPAVRILIRSSSDTMATNSGGEYFETLYEVRADRTKNDRADARDFRDKLIDFAKGLGQGHDLKAYDWVAFIGIRRKP